MYKIAELKNENKTTSTYLDPVVGETEQSVSVMSLKFPFKKQYKTYLEAISGLDGIKRQGRYVIVKLN